MKLRNLKPSVDEGAAEDLVREIRQLSAGESGPPAPPPAYWQNLIVRMNQRIDVAISPRALTISWAARVAIPGVVAIVSFLVGLQYLVPMHGQDVSPLKAIVMSMPDRAVDTLLSDPSRTGASLSLADLGVDPFSMPKEDLAEYLIASANVRTVTETLNDDQITDVLTILGTRTSDLTPGAR
jgi:hypothetical protein